MTTTLSAKGQIVIPSDLRAKLGLEAGDDMLVLCSDDQDILLRPIRKKTKKSFVDLFQKLNGFQFERHDEPVRKITL